MTKYIVQLSLIEGGKYNRPIELESEEVSFRIGTKGILEVVIDTPQGLKKLTVLTKVEKYADSFKT